MDRQFLRSRTLVVRRRWNATMPGVLEVPFGVSGAPLDRIGQSSTRGNSLDRPFTIPFLPHDYVRDIDCR